MLSVQIRLRVGWSSTHTWLLWTSNSMIQADKLGSRSTAAGIVLIQSATNCLWSTSQMPASPLINVQATQQLSMYSAMRMIRSVLATVSVPSQWPLTLKAGYSCHPTPQAKSILSRGTMLPLVHQPVRAMAQALHLRRAHLPHQALAVPRLLSVGHLLSSYAVFL